MKDFDKDDQNQTKDKTITQAENGYITTLLGKKCEQ